MNTFTIGKTYTAKSICDSECIFSMTVTARKGSLVFFTLQGNTISRRVKTIDDGETIRAGSYSMAPVFRA